MVLNQSKEDPQLERRRIFEIILKICFELVFDGQIIPHVPVSGRAITVPNYDIDEGIVESMF